MSQSSPLRTQPSLSPQSAPVDQTVDTPSWLLSAQELRASCRVLAAAAQGPQETQRQAGSLEHRVND